jgi:hypothetical protein
MTNFNFPKPPRYPSPDEIRKIINEGKERTKSDFKINNVLILFEYYGHKLSEKEYRDLEQRWFNFYLEHLNCNTNSNQKEVLIYLLWLLGEPNMKRLSNKLECSKTQFFIALEQMSLNFPEPFCRSYRSQFKNLEKHFEGDLVCLELVERGKLSKTPNTKSTVKSLTKTMKTFLVNLKNSFATTATKD